MEMQIISLHTDERYVMLIVDLGNDGSFHSREFHLGINRPELI
jgi:hypothetical protein